MAPIDPKAAFLHVIDHHRWLASSGCSWNLVGANSAGEIKDVAHRLLPNIDVATLDSLLTHARSLIDFYTNGAPRRDDITLAHFNLSLDKSTCAELEQYKRPIEVHLLHLTNWRDLDFRTLHSTAGAGTDRPNWNSEASKIAALIIEKTLRNVAERGTTGWPLAFEALFQASRKRYRDKLFEWPNNLTEKSDVERFLVGLGL